MGLTKWEKALSGLVCGTVGRAAVGRPADVWGQTWISHNMQPTYYAACTACRTSQWTVQHTVTSDTDSDSLETSSTWQVLSVEHSVGHAALHVCTAYTKHACRIAHQYYTAADGHTRLRLQWIQVCMCKHTQIEVLTERLSPSNSFFSSFLRTDSSTFTWQVVNSLCPEQARCAKLIFDPVPKRTWHSCVHALWGHQWQLSFPCILLKGLVRAARTPSRQETKD